MLDAGSTTTEVAHGRLNRQDLTVITNALNIALNLGAVPGFVVHVPGGQFKAPTLSLSGRQVGRVLPRYPSRGSCFSPPRRVA